ncbi:hypothetical protein V6N13_016715 [Hibiscus sabdariffa]
MEQAYDLFGEWWETLPANRSSILGECQNFWQRLIALVSECKQAQLVTFRRPVLRWQRVLLVLVCSNSSWCLGTQFSGGCQAWFQPGLERSWNAILQFASYRIEEKGNVSTLIGEQQAILKRFRLELWETLRLLEDLWRKKGKIQLVVKESFHSFSLSNHSQGRFSDVKEAYGGALFAKEEFDNLSSECKLIQFRFIARAENKMLKF